MDTAQHYVLSSTAFGPSSVALGCTLTGACRWKAVDENMPVLGLKREAGTDKSNKNCSGRNSKADLPVTEDPAALSLVQ